MGDFSWILNMTKHEISHKTKSHTTQYVKMIAEYQGHVFWFKVWFVVEFLFTKTLRK